MALISMCIQMMQVQTTSKMKWIAQEMGLSDGSKDGRLALRKTRGRIYVTPEDEEKSRAASAARKHKKELRQQKRQAREQREAEERQGLYPGEGEGGSGRNEAAKETDSLDLSVVDLADNPYHSV